MQEVPQSVLSGVRATALLIPHDSLYRLCNLGKNPGMGNGGVGTAATNLQFHISLHFRVSTSLQPSSRQTRIVDLTIPPPPREQTNGRLRHDFRTLTADSGLNTEALVTTFHQDLSNSIKDELASRELGENLESLIMLAIKIDNGIRERVRQRPFHTTPLSRFPKYSKPPKPSTEEAMQMGRTRLIPQE